MEAGIFRVMTGVAWVVRLQRRRRHIVAATPELHLLLTKFRGQVTLVKPLKGTG
jgi:hypothetical protein